MNEKKRENGYYPCHNDTRSDLATLVGNQIRIRDEKISQLQDELNRVNARLKDALDIENALYAVLKEVCDCGYEKTVNHEDEKVKANEKNPEEKDIPFAKMIDGKKVLNESFEASGTQRQLFDEKGEFSLNSQRKKNDSDGNEYKNLAESFFENTDVPPCVQEFTINEKVDNRGRVSGGDLTRYTLKEGDVIEYILDREKKATVLPGCCLVCYEGIPYSISGLASLLNNKRSSGPDYFLYKGTKLRNLRVNGKDKSKKDSSLDSTVKKIEVPHATELDFVLVSQGDNSTATQVETHTSVSTEP